MSASVPMQRAARPLLAEHGAGAQEVPAIGPVVAPQTELLGEGALAAALGCLDGRDIGGAVGGMDQLEPGFQALAHHRTCLEAEGAFELGPDIERCAIDLPVPHRLLGAGERQSATSGILEEAARHDPMAEGELRQGESHGEQDEGQTGGDDEPSVVEGNEICDAETCEHRPGEQHGPRNEGRPRPRQAAPP